MKKVYTTKEALLKDPAVQKFAEAVKELSNEIAFTSLHIKHVIEIIEYTAKDALGCDVCKYTKSINDYFTLDITQGHEYVNFTLSDITLPEQWPIYLSKCELDMLKTNDQKANKKFGDFQTYINMQNAGWFKNVPTDMYIDDIVKHCKIKED